MSAEIPSPVQVRNKHTRLAAFRDQAENDLKDIQTELTAVHRYLEVSTRVTQALESLNQQLFQELLGVIESKMSIALQEVLEQPIELKAKLEWKRSSASVDFWIERNGHSEDIMKGQGGSVANILSVGLRMFALTTLEDTEHRRFLVLDEQDCWLHPDLVPRLVKIIHEAGKALGFQIVMISHHQPDLFAEYADRIYRLIPQGEQGVRLVQEPKDRAGGQSERM